MAQAQAAVAEQAAPPKHVITAAHQKQATAQLLKAVSAIVLSEPFYGYLLLRMEMKEDPRTEHMYTNGKIVGYNAKYVAELSVSKLKGALKHMCMHVANLHHLRRGHRDKKKWDKACDYVVNALAKEAGWDLPDEAIIDMQYKDYSAEHTYQILPEEPEGDGDGDGNGNGDGQSDGWNFGGVEDHPDATDDNTRKQIEQDTIMEVSNAANAARVMGRLPDHIARMVETIKACKLPWREILARFFKSTAKNDYSWMRPNRRFISQGIYLPSLYSTTCGPVVLAVDTSGSIGQRELEVFIAELNGILKFANPEFVKVIYCDAKVHSVETYLPHDDVRATRPKGGGGTAFEPVFDWVDKNMNNNVECVIYLTDMYGSFPEKHPSYPTLWISTTNVDTAPFGKVIHLDV